MTNKEFANYGKPKKIKQAKKGFKNKPVQHTIIKDEAYKKIMERNERNGVGNGYTSG